MNRAAGLQGRGTLLVCAGLAAVAVALLAESAIRGELPLGRDLLPFFYPRFQLDGAALASGTIPRWNPFAGHGQSHFGPRMGVLYPPYMLFGWLSAARAMAWFLILHYLLAAAGTWRLALRTGAAPHGAVAAGIAFAAGGFMASQYWTGPYLVSAAWLPWALLGGVRLGRSERGGGPLLAAALGATLLIAEAQGCLLAAVCAGAVAVWHAPRDPRIWRRVLGAGLLAGGLAGLQLVSMLLELPRTNRALDAFGDSRWGLEPGALLLDLVANAAAGEGAVDRGGFWGYALWGGHQPWCGISVGAVGLAAVALGVRARTRSARLGLFLTALGVALAGSGVGSLISLRYSAKWLVATGLGLALLVGAGFDRATRDPSSRRQLSWVLAGLSVALGLAAALVLGAGQSLIEALEQAKPGYVDGAVARGALLQALGRACVSATLALATLLAHRRGRLPWRAARAALAALLTLELIAATQWRVQTTTLPLLERTALVDLLHREAGGPAGAPPRFHVDADEILERVPFQDQAGLTRAELGSQALAQLLAPNLAQRFGIRQIVPFDSVQDRATTELRADPRYQALPPAIQLALLDVELLLHTDDLPGSSGALLEPLARVHPRVLLYRNLACPPFAYTVPSGVYAPDRATAIRAISDARRFPLDVVVLGPDHSGPPPSPPAESGDAEGRIELLAFEPERVELTVEVSWPSWLVVREGYGPDWVATLDGEPTSTVRADVLFRAVSVPAGRHTVAFRYAPTWWVPGLLLSLLSAAIWLGLAVRAVSGRADAPPESRRPPAR